MKPSKPKAKSRVQQKSVKPLKTKASASEPKQALAHVVTPPVVKKPAARKPATVAQTLAAQQPAAQPLVTEPQIDGQSQLVGHQNQLEQQLDEKIRKKLEEEEGRDAEQDEEKRISQEIRQVMAEAGSTDPDPPKKEEAKKEEPKKEDPPKDAPKEEPKKEEAKKPEEPAKDEKKDKPAEALPAPKKEEKKPAPDLDDVYGDYYYDDDPYFVHSRSYPRAMPKGRAPHRPVHYIDEDILDSLNQDDLMHRLLQDLHIHDEGSSSRAIEYLAQHYQKDTLALKDLVGKAKELDSASS